MHLLPRARRVAGLALQYNSGRTGAPSPRSNANEGSSGI